MGGIRVVSALEPEFVALPPLGFASWATRPNAKRERRKNCGGNVEISNSEIPTFSPHTTTK